MTETIKVNRRKVNQHSTTFSAFLFTTKFNKRKLSYCVIFSRLFRPFSVLNDAFFRCVLKIISTMICERAHIPNAWSDVAELFRGHLDYFFFAENYILLCFLSVRASDCTCFCSLRFAHHAAWFDRLQKLKCNGTFSIYCAGAIVFFSTNFVSICCWCLFLRESIATDHQKQWK